MRNTNNNSGCLTAFIASFSRITLFFAWLARPALMDAAFSTVIIPCLGFLFLPFTTLMYVILIQGPGKIQGLDWLWLVLAAIMDLASIAGAGAANRNRIPAGYPGSYQEKELYDPVTGKPREVTSSAPVAPAQPSAVTPPAPAAPDQPTESKSE
jgi:hypothetical protein